MGRGTSGTDKLAGNKIWNKSSTPTVQVFTLHVPSLNIYGHLQSTTAKPLQNEMAWKPHSATVPQEASPALPSLHGPHGHKTALLLAQMPSAPAFGPYRPGRLTKPARPQLLRKHQPSSLPDLIAGFHANPLRDGPVLLLLLGEEAFDLERLVRRLQKSAAVSPSHSPGPARPQRAGNAAPGSLPLPRGRSVPPPPQPAR